MTPTDHPSDSPVDGSIGPDVFGRLRTIAAGEAARTNPWPGLDRSIRRDRRNRLVGRGVTGAVVAAMLAAAVVPSARHEVAGAASRLLGDGVAAQPIGGALGADGSWTEPLTVALRDRLRAEGGFEPGTLRLLWTDELAGARRAVVSVRGNGSQVGSLQPSVPVLVDFVGGTDAHPDQLAIDGRRQDEPGTSPDVWVWPQPGRNTTGDVAVLALCPGCRDAEWVGKSSFGADLSVRNRREPLARSGANTWQGVVPEAQRPLVEVRGTGPAGTAITSGRGQEVASFPVDLSLFGIPVPRRDAVTSAGLLLELNHGMSWRDVTAIRSTHVSGRSFHGVVAAFRTTSGAWVVGSVPDMSTGPDPGWSTQTVLAPPADVSSLLVPVLTDGIPVTARQGLVVIAPAGAATIEADGRTFPVRDGGAYLDFPSGVRDPVHLSARDAAGREIAATTWPLAGRAGKVL